VASAHGATGGGLAVPSGMRAVSVHVADSFGVLELASAGQKVDLQVFIAGQDGIGQLRTVLQDAAILSKSASDGSTKPAIVTLLVTPHQADLLALADTSARLRMTLRNPLDKDRPAPATLTLAALTQSGGTKAGTRDTSAPLRHEPKPSLASTRLLARRVQFRVRILETGRRVADGFAPWLSAPPVNDFLQVAALRTDFDAESELRGMREKKGFSVVSSSSVSAGNHREVSVQANDQSTAVRLRFVPVFLSSNRFSLRVLPEVVTSGWSRKIDTEVELSDGQSFLVTGLSPAGSSSSSLLVLVTSQLEKPVDTASLQREP
ncbi:MAG: RcpC/CpaB family pilus assembly protein, partial [Acidobacteria bacterium]|nr:RcpC/CpaB family pilus assembly protein [Acidobacteriota bacterium]